MPKRYARFSAVWPIRSPTIGSVSPFMMPITGASSALNGMRANSAARWPPVFAAARSENQSTTLSL